MLKERFFFLVLLLGFQLLGTRAGLAEFRDENILMSLPDGYVVGFQNNSGKMLIMEMVPKGQTVENWTDLITMQVFYQRGDLKPADFESDMVTKWAASCPGSNYQPVKAGVENGYEFSFWILACDRNPATGQGEYAFVKVVRGNDAFYSVQKAFKSDPTNDQIVTWSKFMSQVRVCDSRIAARACPKVK